MLALLTCSAFFPPHFYRQISPFNFHPNQPPFIPVEHSHHRRARLSANCGESQSAPSLPRSRATESIGCYQEGRGWPRAVPSQEGALRPLKAHVYSRGVHADRMRTHTLAEWRLMILNLGPGSLRGFNGILFTLQCRHVRFVWCINECVSLLWCWWPAGEAQHFHSRMCLRLGAGGG